MSKQAEVFFTSSHTSPVADAVQRLEDLVFVVDLAHAAFLLVEEDAVVGAETMVEVGAEVQRHCLQPHLSFHLAKKNKKKTRVNI